MNSAPVQLGSQAKIATSTDGRFSVYASQRREAGHRGAAPFSKYSVYDAVSGKITALRTLAEVDSLVHFRLTGERLGAWYAPMTGSETPAPRAAWHRLPLATEGA